MANSIIRAALYLMKGRFKHNLNIRELDLVNALYKDNYITFDENNKVVINESKRQDSYAIVEYFDEGRDYRVVHGPELEGMDKLLMYKPQEGFKLVRLGDFVHNTKILYVFENNKWVVVNDG